MPAQIAAIDCV